MKHISIILFVFLLFAIQKVNAQAHPLLQDFSGYQQGTTIFLRFTFKSGSLCDGIRIDRSDDGVVFNQIGDIPGICGRPDVPFTYTYTDSFPNKNAMNFYRLELGNYGFTSSLGVEYLTVGDEGFVVLSSPGNAELLIANPPARNAEVFIFDAQGRFFRSFNVNERRFSLLSGREGRGVYFFRIVYENNAEVSGKFLVY